MKITIRKSRLVSVVLMLLIATLVVAASAVTAFAAEAEPHDCVMDTKSGLCTVCRKDMAEAVVAHKKADDTGAELTETVYYLSLGDAIASCVSGDKVTLRKNIVLSESTMTVPEGITLYVNSGVIVSSNLTEVVLVNYGTIEGKGIFNSAIKSENNGTISGGTFNGVVTNNDTLNGGSFLFYTVNNGSIECISDEKGNVTSNPSFAGSVTNNGSISSGSFTQQVVNEKDGIITGGTFSKTVNNRGEIAGGTYSSTVYNSVLISDGIFNGEVNNSVGGVITGGAFLNGKITGSFNKSLEAKDSENYYFLTLSEALRKAGVKAASKNATVTVTLLVGVDLTLNEKVPARVNLGMNSGVRLSGDGYRLDVYGALISGIYDIDVVSYGTISGGTYNYSVSSKSVFDKDNKLVGAKISGGTFNGAVDNDAIITGGTFNGPYIGGENSVIENGTFNSSVSSAGLIKCGSFLGEVTNTGKIISTAVGKFPTFESAVDNSGIIEGGAFKRSDVNGARFDAVAYSESTGVYGYYYVRAEDALATVKSGTTLFVINDVCIDSTTSVKVEKGITLTTKKDETDTFTFGFYSFDAEDAIVPSKGTLTNAGTLSGLIGYNSVVSVTNNATINGGTFNGAVTNNATINGGTFNGAVTSISLFDGDGDQASWAEVNGGVFNGSFTNMYSYYVVDLIFWIGDVYFADSVINGGVFNCAINNYGIINDGTFNSDVSNTSFTLSDSLSDKVVGSAIGKIHGGTFNGGVNSHGIVTGGEFNGRFDNIVAFIGIYADDQRFEIGGVVSGGVFNGYFYNESTVTRNEPGVMPVFNEEVENNGTIEHGAFKNPEIKGNAPLAFEVISNEYYYITFTDAIDVANKNEDNKYEIRALVNVTLDFNLTIGRNVDLNFDKFTLTLTLVLKNDDQEDDDQEDDDQADDTSTSVTLMDGILTVYGTISGGRYTPSVVNYGSIIGGRFDGELTNDIITVTIDGEEIVFKGVISSDNATFNGKVTNRSEISGGSFKASVTNEKDATLSGGSFSGGVDNKGKIVGGVFRSAVNNNHIILGGEFHAKVINNSTIKGGSFASDVENRKEGSITGGSFSGSVVNNGVIDDETDELGEIVSCPEFTGRVKNNSRILCGKFNCTLTNEKTGVILGGEYSGELTNNGAIEDGTFDGTVINTKDGKVKGGKYLSGAELRNSGSIYAGDFGCAVINAKGATIYDGVYTGSVENGGIIKNGSFNCAVDNIPTGEIEDGVFGGNLTNSGTVLGGSFSGEVSNSGKIKNGTFVNSVNNLKGGVISDGSFSAPVTNVGEIAGGYFINEVAQSGLISGGTFDRPVQNGIVNDDETVSAGTIKGGIFKSSVTNLVGSVISGGSFSGSVANNGNITGGEFAGSVVNNKLTGEDDALIGAIISGGTFEGEVENNGVISGGVFGASTVNNGIIENIYGEKGELVSEPLFVGELINNATVNGGRFEADVDNKSMIIGGVFELSSTVTNEADATVSGGIFKGSLINLNIINGGTFEGDVRNEKIIEGGRFIGKVDNYGEIKGGIFDGVVNLLGDGFITDGAFRIYIEGQFEARVDDYHYKTFEKALKVAEDIDKCDLTLVAIPKLHGFIKEYIESGKQDDPIKLSIVIPEGVSFFMESGLALADVFNYTDPESGSSYSGVFELINRGTIYNGIYVLEVTNLGVIRGGSFDMNVYNAVENDAEGGEIIASGSVYGGSFKYIENSKGATVYYGEFKGVTDNYGEIYGGVFGGVPVAYKSAVYNHSGAAIYGGEYKIVVVNEKGAVIWHSIEDGYGIVPVFYTNVINNDGDILGGAFSADIKSIAALLEAIDFGAHIEDENGSTTFYFISLSDALLAAQNGMKVGTVYLYETEEGAFDKSDSEGVLIPDGVMIDADAFVGTVYYRLLEDALADANEIEGGATVYLFRDKIFGGNVSIITVGKNVTLDSNGKYTLSPVRVTLINNGKIVGGAYNVEVTNNGVILGGSFLTGVLNNGEISGGVFSRDVINRGTVIGGTFDKNVFNYKTILGGTFNGDVENHSSILGGIYRKIILIDGMIDMSDDEGHYFIIQIPASADKSVWIWSSDIKLPEGYVMHHIDSTNYKDFVTELHAGSTVKVDVHDHDVLTPEAGEIYGVKYHWQRCRCGCVVDMHVEAWEEDQGCDIPQKCTVCGRENPDHGHSYDEFTHLCVKCGHDEFAQEKAVSATIIVVVVLISMVLVLIAAVIIKNKFGDIKGIINRY